MSATNATTYYELPIFVGTDKPAWLVDWNGAMNAIDTAIKQAKTAGDNAQTTASGAVTDIGTLSTSVSTISGNLTTLTTTVNGHTGSINTINSLIGNGEPTTTDKTLIGAINEIYAMIGGGTELLASNVVYDNTSSSLTADDVQDAIDEIYAMIGSGTGILASNVVYDNTSSGLTADDVQDAIDEVNSKVVDFDLSAYTGTFTITSTGTVNTDISSARYAMNSDKSVGKIYGGVYVTNVAFTANSWTVVATLTSTDFEPIQEDYYINTGFSTMISATSTYGARGTRLHFKTDGTIDIEMSAVGATTDQVDMATLPSCIYFLKDLGD